MRLIYIAIVTFVNFGIVSCSKDNQTTLRTVSNSGGGSVITNVVYATNKNWLGQDEQLALDVYLPPASANVTVKKYPLLVYIHGGGFQTGDKETAKDFASLMSEKGFVVAPINYRIGWTQSETNPCDGDTTQSVEAFYRALQDTRAALRFLAANADKYSIDTNWIFVGGASAGGVTSLGVSYYTQELINSSFYGVADKLGPLDAGNLLTNKYTIKGIVSMWGALKTPDVITKTNAIPTIFFHGEKDNVVPYNVDHFYLCDNYPAAYGTKPLYDILTSFGVPAVAHIDPNGGHGVYTIQFRVNNSACFLNSLISKNPQTGYYIGETSNCR